MAMIENGSSGNGNLGKRRRHGHRRTHQRSQAEHGTLVARTSQRIAACTDLELLFATTCDELYRRLGYQHSAIFVVDAQQAQLVKRAASGRWPGNSLGHCHPIEHGLMGVAVRERRPVLANDLGNDPRYVPIMGAAELQSELAMPLVFGERVLGILDVASTEALHAGDVEVLQIIADQLAVAIGNAQLQQEAAHARDAAGRLYEANRRISAAITVEQVVAVFVQEVAAWSSFTCLMLLAADAEGSELRAAGSFCPRLGTLDIRQPLPHFGAAIGNLLDLGQIVWLPDVVADRNATFAERELATLLGARSLSLIPLRVYDERIGVIALGLPAAQQPALAMIEPFVAVAPQLAIAIDSRRRQLLFTEHERQFAVLEARRAQARELHDSVSQTLFGIGLLSEAVPELLRRDRYAAAESLAGISEMTHGALAEMRTLLDELQPGETPTLTLAGALRVLIEAFERRSGVYANAELDGVAEPPAAVGHALLQIAQEALSNVARHASAGRVDVRLRAQPLRLDIADDGCGFVQDYAGGGLGLLGMQERAASIGAHVLLASLPGYGTRVSVVWPDD